jgi:multiple sugar transport system permease protein
MAEREEKRIGSTPGLIAAYAALVLGAIVMLTPLYWLILTSLRPAGAEFTYPPQWIPTSLHPENYAVAWARAPFWIFTRNTIVVTFSAMVGTLITASMAAYALARLRFAGRNIWFALMMSTMMMPWAVTMIPRFLLFKALGLFDSLWPLIVPYWFGGGAFFVFLIRQFLMTLPIEMEEAALVDGASRLRIFTLITMPLAKPALASVGVFSFISHWNDFMGPLIFTNRERTRTLALGLRYFGDAQLTEFRLVMAVAALMLIPVLVVFFFANKYFVTGMALSGLAGR